jgi:hypothetical protein
VSSINVPSHLKIKRVKRMWAGMTRRYALIDERWARITDLLPGQAAQPGATARDNRLFVDAVL